MTDSARLTMIDAAKLLGRKEYSKAELQGLLNSRHAESDAQYVAETLEMTGMLSGGGRRSAGYTVLKERLVAKGVDRSLAEMLLEADMSTEIERARELLRQNMPGEKDKDKIERFLSFRGIDPAAARAVLE